MVSKKRKHTFAYIKRHRSGRSEQQWYDALKAAYIREMEKRRKIDAEIAVYTKDIEVKEEENE